MRIHRIASGSHGVAQGIQAGMWRRAFAEQGVTLHQADCLVAAAAEGIEATPATVEPNHRGAPGTALAPTQKMRLPCASMWSQRCAFR